jgi:glycosyltransferase involved in cell wall biosynthesis
MDSPGDTVASPGKVLIVVQNLPVPFDRRVWLEATTLQAAGYAVSVICPKGRKGNFRAGHEGLQGVHIYRYAPPPEASGVAGYVLEFLYCWIMTAILSLRVWREQGLDVLHACNPPETFFVLGAFYRLFGKAFLFDHHDLSPEMYVAKGGRPGGLLHRGLEWMERRTFATADVVIAPNESHRQIAVERGRVPAGRVFVVRSGPDFQRLRLLPPEPALRGGARYLACYLGEMCPQDGVDYLLRAADLLVRERGRRDIRFVLLGGGPSLPDLRALRDSLDLQPYVDFTGRVSDEDLCRYLSTADVCLDPDPLTEWSDRSTMNKIMEYMAFGKPIVAFRLKENAFSAGEAAHLVEPNSIAGFADAVESLLADEARRAQMGRAGRARVERELAWEYSRPPLLAAYEMAMAVSRRHGR